MNGKSKSNINQLKTLLIMKTTYYLTLHGNAKVLRATTSIAKIKLAQCASNGLWCKAVEPKTARKMIEDGAEFIKVQDLY